MQNSQNVLVLGASSNPERYSYKALKLLINKGHQVFAIGNKKDIINGVIIHQEKIVINNVNTVTLYLSAKNQVPYYDYILNLKPKQVVFNPGTENPEFYKLLTKHYIAYEEACTLVLLSTNQF